MSLAVISLVAEPCAPWKCDADAVEVLEGCVVLNATKDAPIHQGQFKVKDPRVIVPLHNVRHIRFDA